ncbi:defects in morphology protein 1 [Aspergillus costaricaensis CBS 115574]|uniref:Defects in morphology protein 1 n=1 Tax=Aspergillus costaricaensis CBS 115574 TaxID=1448317 RepID=A0ACD1IAH3_9EURO|nr:defects in morphology protein 1 [Aspergillus costaricaensis CBS 115574]RAK87560.1 defects in morphology protein 1 [Aspergillus costaricaensis CBS 115574]
MSCPPLATSSVIPGVFNDSDDSSSTSDYGSDFSPEEDALLTDLLAKIAPDRHATPPPAEEEQANAEPSSQVAPVVRDIEDQYADPSSSRVPKVLGREKPTWPQRNWTNRPGGGSAGARSAAIPGYYGRTASVEHPNSTEGREREREREAARHQERIERENNNSSSNKNNENTEVDTRSPVERFRRPPMKAFSVTDLISPAWCELQYWYTLTKFGRKPRTAAMKLGSKIHKTLEDEIYTTVPVDITTKEDALALRIWNIIQGLRMLREFGITRELEVWGLVDGELVTGVIDQLSYDCPDPELEATAATYYADVEASRAILPEYQMSLSDYLLSPTGGGRLLSEVYGQDDTPAKAEGSDMDMDMNMASSSQETDNFPHQPRIYLTDVKTRGSGSVPTVKSSSFRPTLLQLQLYYHMLNRLVLSDDVTIDLLASRYNLDPNRPFTDAFINEVGGLNDQFFDAMSSQEFDPDYIPTPQDAIEHPQRHLPSSQSQPESHSSQSSSEDSTTILSTHNTLTTLWTLMKSHLRLTFLPSPPTASPSIPSEFQPRSLDPYPTILSPILTARYISSKPSADLQSPRVLGSRSFLFDPTSMSSYVADQMHWWRGERDPRGVEVMEAWKCRICDFKDDCEWRREREWLFANRRMGRKSKVEGGVEVGV